MIEPDDVRPDIYIGLVGAAGTDLSAIIRELRSQLAIVRYSVEHIKLSALIGSALGIQSGQDEYRRMSTFMKAGDAIRANSPEGGGVAALAIQDIVSRRNGDRSGKARAFVIDSLKHPDEIKLLDGIYVRNYYTLSVYLPQDLRERNLAIKISKDRREPPSKKIITDSRQLISADEKSQGDTAQNVRDAFPRGDFFVNGRSDISDQIKRFVEIVFGEPYATPTLDEYAMFTARGAGYRSSDLSRQIGATIIDRHGSIVATGCNEVPYPGGGFFTYGLSEGIDDNRDFVKQIDPNAAEIQRTLIEVVRILRSAGHIGDTRLDDKADKKLVDDLLQGDQKDLLRDARIRSLIEFGRVVHAEMHAICDAAAAGRSVRGATLYSTTFPCHLCAKHIIAAGIREVVYVEPYPKSLTSQLYADEIQFAHERPAAAASDRVDRVVFRPFHGVAPNFSSVHSAIAPARTTAAC